LLGGDIDPAALAAEVATVNDGDVQERREEFAALEPRFVPLDGANPFNPEIPRQLPQKALLGYKYKFKGASRRANDVTAL
jgi:hypothetical protein